MFTLKALSKIVADDILFYYYSNIQLLRPLMIKTTPLLRAAIVSPKLFLFLFYIQY